MRTTFITLLLLTVSLPAIGQTMEPRTFCQLEDGTRWCTLLHLDYTWDKDHPAYHLARTWEEYKRLFRHFVKPVKIMPNQPDPKPEDDLNRRDLHALGIDLQELDLGKYVVLAAGVEQTLKDQLLFEILNPEYSSRGVNFPCVILDEKTTRGVYRPEMTAQVVTGGTYWIIVTTPTFLERMRAQAENPDLTCRSIPRYEVTIQNMGDGTPIQFVPVP